MKPLTVSLRFKKKNAWAVEFLETQAELLNRSFNNHIETILINHARKYKYQIPEEVKKTSDKIKELDK